MALHWANNCFACFAQYVPNNISSLNTSLLLIPSQFLLLLNPSSDFLPYAPSFVHIELEHLSNPLLFCFHLCSVCLSVSLSVGRSLCPT